MNWPINQSESIDKSESINQWINQWINQSTNGSIHQSSYYGEYRALKQAINRSINHSINQPFNQSTIQSINQSSDQQIRQLTHSHTSVSFLWVLWCSSEWSCSGISTSVSMEHTSGGSRLENSSSASRRLWVSLFSDSSISFSNYATYIIVYVYTDLLIELISFFTKLSVCE